MSSTNNTADSAPAQNINGMEQLYPRQITYQEYRVLSTRNENVTSHVVDINAGTCECDDMQYNLDGENGEICDHLAVALFQAPKQISMDAEGFREFATLLSDAREATQALRNQSTEARIQSSEPEAVSNPSSSSDDDEDTSEGEDISEAEPSDQQEQRIREVKAWINSATDFDSSIDPDIVELKWAEMGGEEGVWLDMAPWNGSGYWDTSDSEWIDRDAYDDAREATSQLFNNQDPIEYTGDPDYINFLPENDVEEVV